MPLVLRPFQVSSTLIAWKSCCLGLYSSTDGSNPMLPPTTFIVFISSLSFGVMAHYHFSIIAGARQVNSDAVQVLGRISLFCNPCRCGCPLTRKRRRTAALQNLTVFRCFRSRDSVLECGVKAAALQIASVPIKRHIPFA